MLKPVCLRHKQLKVPIIQGGMGVGISLGSLAGHVMKEGGMGVISAAHPGYADPDFYQDPIGCNRKALAIEADKARQIGKEGLLGVNIMVAARNYEEYVRTSVQCGYDAIISGAGLPLSLPAWVRAEPLRTGNPFQPADCQEGRSWGWTRFRRGSRAKLPVNRREPPENQAKQLPGSPLGGSGPASSQLQENP